VAYLLVVRVGSFDVRSWADVGAWFVGFGSMALQCARSLGRLRKQSHQRQEPIRRAG
jgi:hypothetical protein